MQVRKQVTPWPTDTHYTRGIPSDVVRQNPRKWIHPVNSFFKYEEKVLASKIKLIDVDCTLKWEDLNVFKS